jgi:hypothetical protein
MSSGFQPAVDGRLARLAGSKGTGEPWLGRAGFVAAMR